MNMRQNFATLYRMARRDKLHGRELHLAAIELIGEGLAGLLYYAVERALRPTADMRRELRRTVLNGFGSKNAWTGKGLRSLSTPAGHQLAHQTATLRKRLQDAGRLDLDAGGWATGEIRPARPKAYIRYTPYGPFVCVKAGGGVWEFTTTAAQMKTPMRIGYTMKRAAEYVAGKLAEGCNCPPALESPFDPRKRAWIEADKRISVRQAHDLIEAERAGNNRLANIIRHRQQQWKDSLAEALAA